MTSCAECLTALATTRLTELGDHSLITSHCATCQRCAEVATTIRIAEQRLAMTLAETRPPVSPYEIAEGAIAGADKMRRRTVARIVRAALAAVGLFIVGTYITENYFPGPRPDVITQTVVLKCVSARDAAEIVTPYLRASAAVYQADNLRTITIRGLRGEVARALSEIDAMETRSCALTAPLPDGSRAPLPGTSPNNSGALAPTPSAGTPGRD